jgi:predicted metal-dependent peptidase
MTDIVKAQKRMDKIVANWYLDDFMMLGAWTLAEKIADPKQETLGIDSRCIPPAIRYNPNFINALTDEVLEAIMASECFKLLLKHPTSRLKNPREISALSSTVTVDQLIMKNLVNTDGIKGVIPLPKDFGLPPDSFYEEYFRLLMDKLDDTSSKMNKMFGPPNGGDGQNQSSDGEGNQEGDNGGYADFSNMKDALKKHMDPRGGNSKNWADNDVLDAEVQNFVDNYKGSSKMWGKFSGDAMGQVVAANTPKISWKEIVRRFNTSVQTSKQVGTRMKPNRRFDLDAPGRRRVYTTKILFAIDASGSMSDDDIAEGFAVINSTCRHAEVHYMLFDTAIKNVEKKMKRAKTTFKISGRGGTDPDPVLAYVDEHKYDGLVVYSDMYFSSNQKKPRKCKVLWLGTQKTSKPPVDWGFHANLSRFEGR